eukprot:992181-Prymnesium_polylepis.2
MRRGDWCALSFVVACRRLIGIAAMCGSAGCACGRDRTVIGGAWRALFRDGGALLSLRACRACAHVCWCKSAAVAPSGWRMPAIRHVGAWSLLPWYNEWDVWAFDGDTVHVLTTFITDPVHPHETT